MLKQVDGVYQIGSADELRKFAELVNGGKTTANAVLTADIDLNPDMKIDEDGKVTNGSELAQWIPIGTNSSRYSGNFNGQNFKISGLYINSSSDNYQGLFGYLSTDGDNTGTVQNLSVSGSVKGYWYVGGVVGDNCGNVINCAFSGSVSGSDRVGGVVGYNDGTVKNCYNTASVNGSIEAGGVVGYNGGNVENCYNTGTVTGPDSVIGSYVGGVVGYNSRSVKNCYNIGKVTGSSYYSFIGGVVGWNRSSVTNCYFLTGTAGSGIGGGNPSADATRVDDLDALCGKFKDDTTWSIHPVLGRPVLNENKEGGLGTDKSPYEISTADELENFRDLVNGASGNPAAWAVLTDDIDLNPDMTYDDDGQLSNPDDLTTWGPIGTNSKPYTGTFNGDGHTISGLYINRSADYQGLFGYVSTDDDNTGTVKDLTVSGSVKGINFVGGIAGRNGGNVINCTFSGSVSGVGSVGGVVGDNRGTVENCYNTGSVTSSDSPVGGVVGYNDTGATVTNCYNTGEVSGPDSGNSVIDSYVGGVVGLNDGTVTGCYYQQQDPAIFGIGGSTADDTTTVAKTAAEFQSGEVAWRLQDGQADGSSQVWGQNIKDGENDNYPQLRAFDAATPQVYKVAFMNDNEEHDAKYANIGMTVGSPTTNPTKEGYTFAGWKDENDSVPSFPITVSGNLTYYAKWYSITASPSALDFGSITEGEERPAAQNVTITNTGNQRVTLDQPTATNFEIGKLSETTLEPDETATFTIQPKDKLPRGSYSEQITITGDNNVSETLTATFTVKEPPYTGKYSYEVFTSVGDNGTISVDRYATEGDKVTIDVTPDQAYKLDDLSVTANGKDVELTANSDGTYTFTMPSADVRITATFAEDPDWSEPEEPVTDVSDIFLDIAPDAWYKDAVQYAYDQGLMTGVSATEFDPEATTTRAMIVSILARLEGVESAEAAGFADVDDNDWYATAVNWAANVGVVNGYEDNTFQPNTAITREQLAAILMNYAAYKGEDVSNRASLATYTDQPSTWAEEAMSWAVAEGLMNGVTADTLQPQGAATRAQVAAILQRFLSE